MGNSKPTRRIVLCLDGTWKNPYDEQERVDRKVSPTVTQRAGKVIKPSNPLKFCRAVKPTDDSGHDQITYYHVGVGSLSKYPGPANELLYLDDRFLGGVWGAGFEANIEEALHFLAVNYEPGDDVFIVGFSRGAATARGLTHFLDWDHGLPDKEDAYFLPQLFKTFVKTKGDPGAFEAVRDAIQADLRQPFHEIPVTYLGVWDTVIALGSRFAATGKSTADPNWSFYVPDTPPACVRHARQALAIDEHRYDFRPAIWTHAVPGQQMEQRWFAGVHSNVGGGYMHDGLANITLEWILEGAVSNGLQIDNTYARYFQPGPDDTLYSSSTWWYTLADWVRGRRGKGRRDLVDQPDTANLTLDASVIDRLRLPLEKLQPARPGGRTPLYRPTNVLHFLACQPNLDAYLASIHVADLAQKPLPPDVLKQIQALRASCEQPLLEPQFGKSPR